MGDNGEIVIPRETILVFAHYLGVDLEREPDLVSIADDALRLLPEGWDLGIGEAGDAAGVPYFFDNHSQQSFWQHPQEEALRRRIQSEREKKRLSSTRRPQRVRVQESPVRNDEPNDLEDKLEAVDDEKASESDGVGHLVKAVESVNNSSVVDESSALAQTSNAADVKPSSSTNPEKKTDVQQAKEARQKEYHERHRSDSKTDSIASNGSSTVPAASTTNAVAALSSESKGDAPETKTATATQSSSQKKTSTAAALEAFAASALAASSEALSSVQQAKNIDILAAAAAAPSNSNRSSWETELSVHDQKRSGKSGAGGSSSKHSSFDVSVGRIPGIGNGSTSPKVLTAQAIFGGAAGESIAAKAESESSSSTDAVAKSSPLVSSTAQTGFSEIPQLVAADLLPTGTAEAKAPYVEEPAQTDGSFNSPDHFVASATPASASHRDTQKNEAVSGANRVTTNDRSTDNTTSNSSSSSATAKDFKTALQIARSRNASPASEAVPGNSTVAAVPGNPSTYGGGTGHGITSATTGSSSSSVPTTTASQSAQQIQSKIDASNSSMPSSSSSKSQVDKPGSHAINATAPPPAVPTAVATKGAEESSLPSENGKPQTQALEDMVTIMPRPDHQSFLVLCRDCTASPNLSTLLLEEVKSLCAPDSEGMAQEKRVALKAAAYDFDNFVAFEALSAELQQWEYCLSNQGSGNSPLKPSAWTRNKSIVKPLAGIGPVARSKAIEMARAFLVERNSFAALPDVPTISDDLVTKMLNIYLSVSDPNQRLIFPERDGIAWRSLVAFCRTAGVWLLIQASIASGLLYRFDASEKELREVRRLFDLLDNDLSGRLAANKVLELLKLMGETYTKSELELILEVADPNRTGYVEFTEFVGWWCSAPISVAD